MVTTYGETTWALCISSSITSDAPSGNYLYFQTKELQINGQMLTSVKNKPGRSSYSVRDGKTKTGIRFTGRVIKKDATSVYNDVNTIKGLIDSWYSTGTAPLYFWAIMKDGSNYYKITFLDNTATSKNYMRGYVENYNLTIERQGNITIAISFIECWT